ncbi:hypothetical protein NQZ68_009247 [Dissostichus eleginoides]|nr:hypothetical protein NQZ68_009247 [Dissostichus eleginoides]
MSKGLEMVCEGWLGESREDLGERPEIRIQGSTSKSHISPKSLRRFVVHSVIKLLSLGFIGTLSGDVKPLGAGRRLSPRENTITYTTNILTSDFW